MGEEKSKQPIPHRTFYGDRPNLERLAQAGLTFVLWIAIGFFVLLEFVVLRRLGLTVPAFGYAFPLSVALVTTFFIWNKYGWAVIREEKLKSINEQIQSQLATLDEKELEDVRKGIRKIPFRIAPGVKVLHSQDSLQEKSNLDNIMSELSDEELRDLRERLWEKDISENELQRFVQQKHYENNADV